MAKTRHIWKFQCFLQMWTCRSTRKIVCHIYWIAL